MPTKTARRKMPASYFDHVNRFPLVHLRDDRHLAEAQEVLDALLQENLDDGSRQYLDVLTDLIEAYEEAHVPIADASEADVLRELMRVNGLSQQKLARAVGMAQSTVSAVLSGSRSLTKGQVVRLGQFFHVSPATFLPEGTARRGKTPLAPA